MTTFRFGDLAIECASRAGDATWMRVHPPGLAIDVGRGTTRLRGAEPILLTHGHLDHSLGVAFLLSLRGQADGPPLRVYCPAEAVSDLDAMLAAAGKLDGGPFRYDLRPVVAGDRFEVERDLSIEAFATEHVVPSVGYHLMRRRRRLRADLAGLDGAEIAHRKRSGETVEESFEERWLSCTGDTTAKVFDRVPELYDSRVLVTECTFLDPAHRDRASRFGHVHLEDLVARRELFRNRFLVLGHLSGRHRVAELRAAVDERLEPIDPEVLIVGESSKETSDGPG